MEQRNLVLAIVASVVILLGFQYFYEMPRLRQQQAVPPVETAVAPPEAPAVGTATPAPAEAAPVADRASAIAASPRIALRSPDLAGSIALEGGRLDDLVLARYRETVDRGSKNIVLLSPENGPDAYYVDFGWLAPQEAGLALPGPDTPWTADAEELAPGRPLTLTWDNGQGLVFTRTFALEDTFLFTVTERVENKREAPVTLRPYGLVSRTGTPKTSGFFILHEGVIGVLDETLKEVKYEKTSCLVWLLCKPYLKNADPIEQSSIGGWLGITDKYWLVALVPDQEANIDARFSHALRGETDVYHAEYYPAPLTVPSGGAVESVGRLFAGAKEVRLLDRYRDQLGIQLFDRGVDFGWFYFLTKPIFYMLDYVSSVAGNFGVAILILTITIKLLFYPLANKSYRAMSRMKMLAPEMTKLRERFKDDRPRMQQEVMALYKREKVNPASGCLPIVIQIPVFFALYKVLFVTIEMRHAPFFGWIKDLSSPDPTSIFNLFGLAPWAVPDLGPLHLLSIGVWPLVMGLTMFLQQKLNPTPPDPIQARIFMLLPIVFTFMLARFPAGLVIYWAWNNVLSITQQRMIMWRMGVKP